jgi:hypothetical protein
MTPAAIALFFVLGALAGLLRSDLKIPKGLYDALSIFLLLAIGLKGGVSLSNHGSSGLWFDSLAVIAFGALLPLIAYPLLKLLGRMPKADAASIAAHYGSVSVGTYAIGAAFLEASGIAFEDHLALFVVLLEMPAIAVGILLARPVRDMDKELIGKLLHEVFLNKGMLLMGGGLLIGWIAGAEGLKPVKPFFFDLFNGFLALFLLEMGLLASSQLGVLRKNALVLIPFALIMPLIGATLAALLATQLGLSVGGTAMLAILGGSASYIAVPAAMRIAVPEARAPLSIAASLGITFPFNVLIGIPLYLQLSQFLNG